MDVVSYRNSTSNHNNFPSSYEDPAVVSYRNSTSNHNRTFRRIDEEGVVSYRNSTSNHNTTTIFRRFALLYLIEILHQTTTVFFPFLTVLVLYLIEILHQTTTHGPHVKRFRRCILSKFYIKPQPPA